MEAGLPIEVLEADSPDESSGGVRLATMHRVKGLEFGPDGDRQRE